MSTLRPLSLVIAGFLLVAVTCIAIPSTHALGWSLLGVPTAVAEDGNNNGSGG